MMSNFANKFVDFIDFNLSKILCTQNTGREENRSYNGKMAMDGFIA